MVLASEGYPGSYSKGKKIEIGSLPPSMHDLYSAFLPHLTHDIKQDVVVFHAGTAQFGDDIVSVGGRVLAVTAHATVLQEALDLVYKGVEQVKFEGKTFRRDIAHR